VPSQGALFSFPKTEKWAARHEKLAEWPVDSWASRVSPIRQIRRQSSATSISGTAGNTLYQTLDCTFWCSIFRRFLPNSLVWIAISAVCIHFTSSAP
jgi:hypothetical protein